MEYDYQLMKFEFPDEDIMYIRDYNIPDLEEGPELWSWWTMVFDGASNALGNGVGAIITSPKGSHAPLLPESILIVPITWLSIKLVFSD